MTENVWVALITTGGTVVIAVIGVALELLRRELKGIKQDTSVAKEQVTNSHEENFRVEMSRRLDGISDAQTAGFAAVHRRLDRQAGAIKAGAREVAALGTRLTEHIDGA